LRTDNVQNHSNMSELLQKENVFNIDSIPEPANLEDVIYSLMVNPNLSSINYFNDFGESNISPDVIGDSETDESGLFEIDLNGNKMVMSTHAFHHHLQNDPQKATEILTLPILTDSLLLRVRKKDSKMQQRNSALKSLTEKSGSTIFRNMDRFHLRLLSA